MSEFAFIIFGCNYICTEEILPGASIAAGAVGLLLVIWHEVLPLARKLLARFKPQPSQAGVPPAIETDRGQVLS